MIHFCTDKTLFQAYLATMHIGFTLTGFLASDS